MTREYFLYRLTEELKDFPAEERNEIHRYYLEYFEDRGVFAGAEVPDDVASPENIARELLRARQDEYPDPEKPKDGTRGGSGAGTDARTDQENFEKAQASDEKIPADAFDHLDVKLSMVNLRIETADIAEPVLLTPLDKWGKQKDYRLIWHIEDRRFILRDRFQRDWSTKSKRVQDRAAVLRLPRSLKLKTAKLELGMGSTKLIDINCERMDVKNSFGSLHVYNSTIRELYAEVSMGSIILKNAEIFGSELTTNMGSFKGEGILHGRHEISCMMGSVNLKLHQPRAGTSVCSDVSVGSFKINGQNIPVQERPAGGKEAELFIDVSVGSVTIDFLK